jgi:hypothetical protein
MPRYEEGSSGPSPRDWIAQRATAAQMCRTLVRRVQNCRLVLSDITVVGWIVLVVKLSLPLLKRRKLRKHKEHYANAPQLHSEKVELRKHGVECEISRFLFPISCKFDHTSLCNS